MLEKILEYQNTEAKLISTQNEINKSSDKEKATVSKKKLQTYKARLLELDNSAVKINESFSKAKEKYQEYLKKLEALEKELEGADETKVAFYEKAYKDFYSVANSLEKDITSIYNVIQQIDVEYRELLDKFQKEKVNFLKFKAVYDKLKGEKEPIINDLGAKLESMKKTIADELLHLYMQKREGNVFPVFVMLNANKCGGCRMEVSASKLGSMASNKFGIIECENCGRYIYKK